ncbi:SRPBCC family protein [Nitrospira sp. Nam80]
MSNQRHAGDSITLDYADPREDSRARRGYERGNRHQGYGWPEGATRATNEALGWFSIGLGVAELAAPRFLAKTIGVPGHHPLLFRLLGLREISSGLGILARRQPAVWMRSRVWGDMMDLALLGAWLAAPRGRPERLLAATAAVAGVTWLDKVCSRQLEANPHAIKSAIHMTTAVTVSRSPDDLYRFWRDFHNLPSIMPHLESVQATDGARSHWVAKAAPGLNLEWDAELIEDKQGELLTWRSLEGAEMETSGTARFARATGGRGTVVWVELHYDPPAGRLGSFFAKMLGRDPAAELREGLRRFKQVMETGEMATTHGQPAGHSGLAILRKN